MIRVAVANEHPRYKIGRAVVTGYVRRVLRKAGISRAEVSVVFIGSRFIRKINRRYLGHDEVTDVISFTLGSEANLEGEVYVNLDRARQQARSYDVTFACEVSRLVIHGTLHLVGFDDRTRSSSQRMTAEQESHVKYWFGVQNKERG